MTPKQVNANVALVKEVLLQDRDFLRPLVQDIIQQVLEAEMEEVEMTTA